MLLNTKQVRASGDSVPRTPWDLSLYGMPEGYEMEEIAPLDAGPLSSCISIWLDAQVASPQSLTLRPSKLIIKGIVNKQEKRYHNHQLKIVPYNLNPASGGTDKPSTY